MYFQGARNMVLCGFGPLFVRGRKVLFVFDVFADVAVAR
jgi:hypothetical protein